MSNLISKAANKLRRDLLSAIGATLVMFVQSGVGAIARTLDDKGKENPTVADYGAKGDGVTNDTAALAATAAAHSVVRLTPGTYRASQFPTVAGREYRGQGAVTVSLFNAGDSALVKLQSDSYYEGIAFKSTEPDLNSQRVAIDNKTNVTARRCQAIDFKNPTNSNGWGVLIQNSSNVLLDNWIFSGNTLADIAITDTCRDITVIHPINTVDGGVTLDIEPNNDDGLVGGNFIGGHYKKVMLLENQYTAYASRNLVFSGCRIDTLMYDGAGACFENCQIGSIIPEGSGVNVYAGALMIDSANLGPNLLSDPYLFDVSPTDATCFWTAYVSSGSGYKRINDANYGKYCRINPIKLNQQVIITTRNAIPVTAGETLMVFLRSRCDNSGTGTISVGHVVLQWFDAGNNLLSTTKIYNNRAAVNVFTDWANDIATPKVPANATSMKVRITTDYDANSGAALDVGAVGLFRFSLLPAGGNGNMQRIIGALSEPVTHAVFYQNQAPNGNQSYAGGLVGDRIVRKTPVVGQPKGWDCTADYAAIGDAGTWVSEGNL